MIPRIMDDTKTLPTLVTDETCIGRLPEAISCTATEARNGEFVATMQVPVNAMHYADLHEGGIIKLKANDNMPLQLFRISKITKALRAGTATVEMEHISYDLKKVAVLPFKSIGMANFITEVGTHVVGGVPFTLTSNIPNTTAQVMTEVPKTYREVLGGSEGSALDIFSGPNAYCEFKWDNLHTSILDHRGVVTGIVIECGKNLLDMSHDINVQNVYNAAIGYATNPEGTAVTSDLLYVDKTPNPMVTIVDLSDKLDEGETPTRARLNELLTAYLAQNDITAPTVSINLSVQQLRKTDQYEDLKNVETLNLCDYVTIRVADMGIDMMAEVVQLEYDVLAEEVKNVVIGNYVQSLATTIAKKSSEVQTKKVVAELNRTIDQEAVFNRLTNNGTEEGLYFEDNHLYINLTYAKAGTISADMIKGGMLKLGGENNSNGQLWVYNANGEDIAHITRGGMALNNAEKTQRMLINTGNLKFYRATTPEQWVSCGFISGYSVYGDIEVASASQGSVYLSCMNADGETQASQAILTKNGFYVTGALSATGTKSRLVETDDYGKRLLYAYEMPSPMFGDIGEGFTDENGECIITIDDVFGETVSTWTEYQVFLQPEGEGSLYVADKKRNYFTVRGTADLKFAWEVKVKQRDYEFERIDEYDALKYTMDDTIMSAYEEDTDEATE